MYTDFFLIDDSLRQKIIHNATNYKYNKPVFDAIIKNEQICFDQLKLLSNDNLNRLRKNIAIEVVQKINKNNKKNLFYIEAPTGSGKTNVSNIGRTHD